MAHRKLRGGMVGGGIGAFIGPVHRMAATLDGEAEFVAGAFSSNPAKSKKSGKALYLDPKRVYADYREMIKKESALPAGDRIDFVSIVTPNNTHFEIAKAFLEAGFHVVCDKPMTFDLAQAKELKSLVKKSRKVFALTHNYTGYPMVKQARHMVKKGDLGTINKVVVEYPQGWLSGLLSSKKSSINTWRMDPKKAGAACCMGDIGTHAENLARYVTGLQIDELCADLTGFIPGNKLDDDGNVLLHFKGGARGILYASQISAGEENGLAIRVYGSKAGLEWRQEDPNYLVVKDPSGFKKILSKGNPVLCKTAQEAGRLPFGHPDGFIEAFANIYREAYRGMRAAMAGKKIPSCDHPTVDDGVIGMAFIETVVASVKSKQKWTKMKR
ncbi:MAG: gfo/Idh/MocA family oxidoreductase [Chitinivibrionales bacterium]|nr:gfo/Idh/MocA family oxidoreductase [Chitinivibrionales bacterium]